MDLIYADSNRKELGIMDAYTLDMAFGEDENTFEVKVDRNDHICDVGYFAYVEGTEFGGIVDQIKADTEKGEITYIGRTWHGILASKVIKPTAKKDYLILNGNANTVLSQLITQMDLQSFFSVRPASDTDIQIESYQMERYVDGYTGIRDMLRDADAKLRIEHSGDRIYLSAVYRDDYSGENEFNSSQVTFTVKKNYHPVNHIVAMGKGDLADRYIIHVFTDENGGVQKYSNTDTPIYDTDYILDESQKQCFGVDEVTEVLDQSSSQDTSNYVVLTSKPNDWKSAGDNYYEFDEEGGDYKHVDVEHDYSFNVLSSRPADWNTSYGDYYFAEHPGDYKPVEGNVTETYSRIASIPNDWSWNYKKYYNKYDDGVTVDYVPVSGDIKYSYHLQTRQPSDWSDRYNSYYKKKKKGGYETVKKVKKKVPAWKAKTYYTRESIINTPVFSAEPRFAQKQTTTTPAWSAGTYYTMDQYDIPPTFVTGKYYKKVDDHFAELVKKAIERFEEAWNDDELTIALEETDQAFDIGDLVGTHEEVTGIDTVQEVTKKILKVTANDISIKYEVS